MCWEQKAKEQTVDAAPTEQATGDGAVRVQGRTLEEWKEIGKQNENLPEERHIHPDHPHFLGEDRPATDAEIEAFINSMTIDEAMEGLSLSLILGGAGAFA